MENHVIVGGYGRTGHAVAHVLRAAGYPLVVVELNHAIYAQIVAEGLDAIWGDITAEEILHAVNIERARLMVLATPDPATVHLAVQRSRQINPKIQFIARAVREHQVQEFRAIGIDSAVQPEFEGGVEMVRQALLRFECDTETTVRLAEAARKEFYKTESSK
jgi:CPA2 family monovalent cation:H+ antiporter-2